LGLEEPQVLRQQSAILDDDTTTSRNRRLQALLILVKVTESFSQMKNGKYQSSSFII
jgi:hypothetical protein